MMAQWMSHTPLSFLYGVLKWPASNHVLRWCVCMCVCLNKCADACFSMLVDIYQGLFRHFLWLLWFLKETVPVLDPLTLKYSWSVMFDVLQEKSYGLIYLLGVIFFASTFLQNFQEDIRSKFVAFVAGKRKIKEIFLQMKSYFGFFIRKAATTEQKHRCRNGNNIPNSSCSSMLTCKTQSTAKAQSSLSQGRSWLHDYPHLITDCLTAWRVLPTACPLRSLWGSTCQWRNRRKCRIRALGSWDGSGALQENRHHQCSMCGLISISISFIACDGNHTPLLPSHETWCSR